MVIEQTNVPSTSDLYNTDKVFVGIWAANSSSTLIGETITQIQFYLKKSGSVSGNVTAGVYRPGSNDPDCGATNPMTQTFWTKPADDLSTSSAWVGDGLATGVNYTIQENDAIGIHYDGTGSSAVVSFGLCYGNSGSPFNDTPNTHNTRYECAAGTWTTDETATELGFKFTTGSGPAPTTGTVTMPPPYANIGLYGL